MNAHYHHFHLTATLGVNNGFAQEILGVHKNLQLEGMCTPWRCKSVPTYYIIRVDKYWQCKCSSSWVQRHTMTPTHTP